MVGRRLKDGDYAYEGVQPGDYWRDQQGTWFAETPNGLRANLTNHNVVEHDDGTITAHGSILVNRDRPNTWHGYLERGIWREC